MSSRLEAIAQRIQGVSDMKKLTKSMGGVVKGMDQVRVCELRVSTSACADNVRVMAGAEDDGLAEDGA